MKKSEWSDNELEELLRQMPKILDHRNPRDIYQNLSLKRRKIKSWLLPGIAAAAALLLFFILAPKLMDGTNFSFDKTQDEKSTANQEMKMTSRDLTPAVEKNDALPKKKAYSETEQPSVMKAESIKTAIYEDELEKGTTVFTYWIPDPQVQILIPVSIIAKSTGGQPWLTQYTKKMPVLTEEEWGLSEFYPLNGTMELDNNNSSVWVDVPSNHQYGQGSTSETNFINVLKRDISSNSNLKKIKFSTNGNPGIELGNYGKLEEVDVVPDKRHAYLFYYPEGSDLPFLTPTIETFNDINTAIEVMKSDQPLLGLKSSLKSIMPLHELSVSDKTLFVSLRGNANLQDNQQSSSSLEALLLTAKEFGIEKVVIKDSAIPAIGSFNLSKDIKVPVAPNLRNIE
ncbi:negative regulator of sigma-X activity [Neobacillus bataviensis LMG 21833]|uniref:Negative regulator of sigma-X activity n=1 Tax=Neobacillus bataviensis LMG 21833 TaxID=1117379 RepID=K6DMT4_9BACI|nr:hypothetical protein [Neobacillus bataviensis]EKN69644.1 negative regulator of sigma-X activity [Neobacillus bataviensis LMG 21833]